MTEAPTLKPLSPIRKIIAHRVTEAKQTIPHFRLEVDIEADALLAFRKELQKEHADEKLSLNDLMIKACAGALMDVPAVNIQWSARGILQCHTADIAVVIGLEDGLSTPIVRRSESRTIWEISREIRDLASRAAKNALKMDDISGGSFSVSNLGMFGVDRFDAIINPPQCAILAVGSARPRVVAGADGQVRIATVLSATLSVDHRAIDGATAARFLAALRRRIENPVEVSGVVATRGGERCIT